MRWKEENLMCIRRLQLSRLENRFIHKVFTADGILNTRRWKIAGSGFSQKYLMGPKFFELGMLYKTSKDAASEAKPLKTYLKDIAKLVEIPVKSTEKIKTTQLLDINPMNHDTYFMFVHGGGATFTNNHYQELYKSLYGKVGVCAPEFRGYGVNYQAGKGMDLRKTMSEDVDAGIQYLLNKGIKEEKIILMGYCGGCTQALDVAQKYPQLKQVILMSPYTSFEYIPAANSFVTYLKHHSYKSPDLLSAQNVEAPVSIIHVNGDQILPFKAPLELSKKVKNLKDFIIIQSDKTHWFNRTKIDLVGRLIDKCISS